MTAEEGTINIKIPKGDSISIGVGVGVLESVFLKAP